MLSFRVYTSLGAIIPLCSFVPEEEPGPELVLPVHTLSH